MKENLLDNHFKEKLSNYSSPVPDYMWERIAQQTPKKPKAIWWNSQLLLLVALLATTGLLIIFSKSSKNNIVSQNTYENNNQQKSNSQQNNSANLKSSKNNTTTAIPSESSSTNNSLKTNKATSTDYLNNNPPNQTISSALNSSTQKIKTVAKIKSNIKKYNASEKTSTKTNIITNKSNVVNSLTNNNNNAVVTNEVDNSKIYVFEKANPLLSSSLKKNHLVDRKLSVSKFLFNHDCPTINKEKRNDFYIETFFAPEYTFKKIISRDTVNAAYLKLKDSAEKMMGGFTAGFRLSKAIGNHLLLKAGLQYAQLNERLNIRIENDRKIITVITIKTVTDAFGNTTTVSDTSSYIQLGYKTINTYNHYKNIEIPIALSYELDKEKYKLAINAGVLLNIASWYKGTVLSPTYQLVNVSSKENKEIYQQKIGISLMAGISYIKPLSNTLDFFAEPYFRWNLSKNQPYNTYGFKQRFSAVGVSLGLRYNINH